MAAPHGLPVKNRGYRSTDEAHRRLLAWCRKHDPEIQIEVALDRLLMSLADAEPDPTIYLPGEERTGFEVGEPRLEVEGGVDGEPGKTFEELRAQLEERDSSGPAMEEDERPVGETLGSLVDQIVENEDEEEDERIPLRYSLALQNGKTVFCDDSLKAGVLRVVEGYNDYIGWKVETIEKVSKGKTRWTLEAPDGETAVLTGSQREEEGG